MRGRSNIHDKEDCKNKAKCIRRRNKSAEHALPTHTFALKKDIKKTSIITIDVFNKRVINSKLLFFNFSCCETQHSKSHNSQG